MSPFSQTLKKVIPLHCGMVVVAAGSSLRMGFDKLTAPLCGTPVLARTLLALNRIECVDEIVLVTREDRLEEMADFCRQYGISKLKSVVCGGKTRTESALAGLLALSGGTKYALIHDGARPLVTEEVVEKVLKCAMAHRNACPAVSVTDTIKRAEAGRVIDTPDRSTLYAVQTPQGFLADLAKTALTKAVSEGKEYTDDCAAVEALGVTAYLSEGSRENIKITTPLDLALAELIIRQREERT